MVWGREACYDGSTYITFELASSLDHSGHGAPFGGAVFHPVIWLGERSRNNKSVGGFRRIALVADRAEVFAGRGSLQRTHLSVLLNKYPMTSRGFPGVLSNGRWFETDAGSATV